MSTSRFAPGEAAGGLRAAARGGEVGGGRSALAARRRTSKGRLKAAALRPDVNRSILGADTTVVVDGEILGKPRDDEDARGDAAPAVRAGATRC